MPSLNSPCAALKSLIARARPLARAWATAFFTSATAWSRSSMRSTLNTPTTSTRRAASSSKARAAAAASSTSAALCCVTESICTIARLMSSTPALCSDEARAISPITLSTCSTLVTTSLMVPAAVSARCRPRVTLPTEASMSALISFAAAALRWARPRTSAATTANPRPCSPARAASTAAFRARMLV
ncbi:MAG: hypothetical protein A2050_09440 [Candidatus Rokubacteria bacterium GWA2_73_35]|nr:MAG: hypothetical protein A2050_09440 [Candidatus Rokubacteria bacterium GWA2_73_35]